MTSGRLAFRGIDSKRMWDCLRAQGYGQADCSANLLHFGCTGLGRTAFGIFSKHEKKRTDEPKDITPHCHTARKRHDELFKPSTLNSRLRPGGA